MARDTDPQVVGVVADALQEAQRFGKDDVGFGVALAGFHAPDVQVADLPVQRVELALGRADFQGQDGVVVAEGAQRPGVNRVGKARELRQIALGFVAEGNLPCLLYTSDAADERSSVDLGGRRIIKKKKTQSIDTSQFIRK